MSEQAQSSYVLRLEKFEGPFDLLFHLIEKNQIDLYDIPIVMITDQYLDYIQTMEELDLEFASEFLVMAATLLHIKSRMLLPVFPAPEDENEIDPREELILKLVEYKRHKEFAKSLQERFSTWCNVFYKLPEVSPEVKKELLFDVSPALLHESYCSILKKLDAKMNHDKSKMARILDNEKVSLKSKMMDILRSLSELAKDTKMRFSELFNIREKSRLEIATGFLAMLEVAKIGKATIEQSIMFSEIWINPVKNSVDLTKYGGGDLHQESLDEPYIP